MKSIALNYQKSSGLEQSEIQKTFERLRPEMERMREGLTQQYDTDYASLNLPNDIEMAQTVKRMIDEKQQLNPTAIVIIGIGGSNLGARAIHEGLYGHFYNQLDMSPKVYWADTIDSDYIWDIVLLIEQELEKGNTVLINVISKSGGTTETAVNFEIFKHLLQKAFPENWRDYIVVTTDHDSALARYAHEEKLSLLAIPKLVGGRYSVFSPAGLFPLGMLGVDIDELVAGASSVIHPGLSDDLSSNIAAIRAAYLYLQYKKGRIIHDAFIFSVDLEGYGKWYRQLVAESLGKEYDRDGKLVEVGITPTVSIGTTDLHSVAQLYLGGPRDKCTTFLSVHDEESEVIVPDDQKSPELGVHIKNKSITKIYDTILNAVMETYLEKKRPFVNVRLPEKSAYYLGQLMQVSMIQIMYVGFLLNINPFDQPNVELYKQKTRKMLS